MACVIPFATKRGLRIRLRWSLQQAVKEMSSQAALRRWAEAYQDGTAGIISPALLRRRER